MRQLISFFVKYPIWANGLIVLTIIFGLLAFFNTKKAHFPETIRRNVTISVAYPGASALEMDEGVTSRVEQSLKGIVGIDEINSTSSENNSVVKIIIGDNEDVEEVLVDIKNAVDQISRFPDGAEKPVVFKAKPTERAATVSLKGSVSLLELKQFATSIENEFLLSGKISEIEILGFPAIEIAIEVKEEVLKRYSISFDEIAAAIRSSNKDVSAGIIKTKQEELLVRSRNKKLTADALGEIVIRSADNGSQILLKDIALVQEKFAEDVLKSELNGQRNIVFNIRKLPEEDLKEISAYLNEYIQDFNTKHSSTSMLMVSDKYVGLEQRIDMLMSNGVYGLLFVLIALGLFLNLRLSLWVAWGIPASFLGMFIIGSWVDISINMISLFGMIVVVGILVDDGIVIAENIFVHFKKGKKPQSAAIDGTMEVLPAVFTSVATTILAFIPLLMIEGSNFIAEMAIVVIASLGFSLIEATLVLPSHLANKETLSNSGWSAKIAVYSDRLIYILRDVLYSRLLRFIIANKYVSVTMPILLVMLVFGFIASGHIKMTPFPSLQKDDFAVDIAFKPGEREDKTERYLNRFEEKVWEVNDEIIKETGDTLITYTNLTVGVTRQLGEKGGHAGNVAVSIDTEGKSISSLELIRRVREKIGKVPEAEKVAVGSSGRWGKPVSINLLGKNLEELNQAKEFLVRELKQMKILREVSDNNSVGKNELLLKLKPEAYFLGLNTQEITKQIRQAYFGEEVQRLVKGEEEVKIWVRYPIEDRMNLGQLEQMMIRSKDGKTIPLNVLADYSITRGVTQIKRLDGARSIKVTAELANPNAELMPINNKIKTEIITQLQAQFPTVKVAYGGQGKHGTKTVLSVLKMLPIVFLVMILLISLNFRSFYQALLIISLIPVGLASGIIGHAIHGIPLSVLSLFGALALGGIIVNDAVVMLDKFNQNMREGLEIHEAVYKAGLARFRAILLTSITTIVGLAPLIVETNFQARFIVPMAITMAYGVLIGTLFILLFFPVIILMGNSILKRVYWLYPDGPKIIKIVLFPFFASRWIYQEKYKEPLLEPNDVEPALMEMNNDALKNQEDEK